ncbi:MAG: flagellar basal body P-ring formation chaperone FlgA [Hyphomicrobiaceae bacterium]
MQTLRRQSWISGLAVTAAAAVLCAAQTVRADDLELPVPKAIVYPGDTVTEEMLVPRAFIARTVARSTVFETSEGLAGKVAKRTLLPGQPIPIAHVRDPYLVTQGKTALVIFEEGGLTISTRAMALQNGGAGDMVSLRNMDSGTVIKGMVAGDGSVRLGAP